MGIIGLIDDYLKVVKKYSKGLVARYKLAGQIFLGAFISIMLIYNIILLRNHYYYTYL